MACLWMFCYLVASGLFCLQVTGRPTASYELMGNSSAPAEEPNVTEPEPTDQFSSEYSTWYIGITYKIMKPIFKHLIKFVIPVVCTVIGACKIIKKKLVQKREKESSEVDKEETVENKTTSHV